MLGGFAVWFVCIEAAPVALYLINIFTSGLDIGKIIEIKLGSIIFLRFTLESFKIHLINSVPYFRYLIMGMSLLLIMRYRPRGILPEKIKHV